MQQSPSGDKFVDFQQSQAMTNLPTQYSDNRYNGASRGVPNQGLYP